MQEDVVGWLGHAAISAHGEQRKVKGQNNVATRVIHDEWPGADMLGGLLIITDSRQGSIVR